MATGRPMSVGRAVRKAAGNARKTNPPVITRGQRWTLGIVTIFPNLFWMTDAETGERVRVLDAIHQKLIELALAQELAAPGTEAPLTREQLEDDGFDWEGLLAFIEALLTLILAFIEALSLPNLPARPVAILAIITAGLLAANAKAQTISGPDTAKVNEQILLDLDGEPVFNAEQTIGENVNTLNDWMTLLTLAQDAPATGQAAIEQTVDVKFQLGSPTPLLWDVQLAFTADAPGVYVLVAVHSGALDTHRVTVGGELPPPNPEGKLSRVTILEETGDHASRLRINRIANSEEMLTFRGDQIGWREFDDDVTDGDGNTPPDVQACIDAAGDRTLPVACLEDDDGRIFAVIEIPETALEMIESLRPYVEIELDPPATAEGMIHRLQFQQQPATLDDLRASMMAAAGGVEECAGST